MLVSHTLEIYPRIEEANLLRQITDGCDLVEV